MPENGTMRMTVLTPLQAERTVDGLPMLAPMLEMGDGSKKARFNLTVTTGLESFSYATFWTPAAGPANLTLGVVLSGRLTTVNQSHAVFLLQRWPLTQPNTADFEDNYQVVKWTAVMAVAGTQTNASLAVLNQYLGAGGQVTHLGWRFIVPVLLRDYSIATNCTAEGLAELTAGLASKTGLPMAMFNSSCTALGPGGARAYLSSSTSAGGRKRRQLAALTDTFGLCGDAKMAVNITLLYAFPAGVTATSSNLTALLANLTAVFTDGVDAVLSTYDSSLYCTSLVRFDTLARLSGAALAEQDYGITQTVCNRAAATGVATVRSFAEQQGVSTQLLFGGPISCSGSYNCVDCWPYSNVTQWQIVLMTFAFMLLVVVLLGVRIKVVQRWQASQPVPAGVLDVRRTILAVKAAQLADEAFQPAHVAPPPAATQPGNNKQGGSGQVAHRLAGKR